MRVPNWYRNESDGVRFYRAWHLHETGLVVHGFSARTGGVSHQPYQSLNLGLGTNDEPADVLVNRERFASVLGLDAEQLVAPVQVHSNAVARVTASDAGSGARSCASGIQDTDALITSEPGLCLALHFADCACVFLLDPLRRAIGVAHAGWRGTVGGVIVRTVAAMSSEFGSQPTELLAAIGPSIGRCCYEVGPDVAHEFFRAFPHDERVMKQAGADKWRVDLKTANRLQLERAGLDTGNIVVSDECTCCDRDEFYSHRRDGETGRMGGWMALLPV